MLFDMRSPFPIGNNVASMSSELMNIMIDKKASPYVEWCQHYVIFKHFVTQQAFFFKNVPYVATEEVIRKPRSYNLVHNN